MAAEFSVALAHRYVVVLVAAPDFATHVDRIAAAAPAGSVTGVRGTHVVVLSPNVVPDRGLVDQVLGATVAVGHPAEPGLELAKELRRTESLLAVALEVAGPGWYGPDDLLLERLVGGSPQVAESLVRLIVTPLRVADRGGMVESTLRTFLRTGSVPETAEIEVVHPNTVAYRLGRVALRTGYDPRIPVQAAALSLALLAASAREVVDPTTSVGEE